MSVPLHPQKSASKRGESVANCHQRSGDVFTSLRLGAGRWPFELGNAKFRLVCARAKAVACQSAQKRAQLGGTGLEGTDKHGRWKRRVGAANRAGRYRPCDGTKKTVRGGVAHSSRHNSFCRHGKPIPGYLLLLMCLAMWIGGCVFFVTSFAWLVITGISRRRELPKRYSAGVSRFVLHVVGDFDSVVAGQRRLTHRSLSFCRVRSK